MRIKKKQLELLSKIIIATTPRFVEARFRDRFFKKLSEEFKQFNEDRIKLCEGLSKLDAEGKPIIVDGQFQIEDDKKDELEKEFDILKEEDISIILEGDEASRLVRLIESTNYTPAFGEVETIEKEIIANIK